jgi:adrenodoxin-NADP+ reductase
MTPNYVQDAVDVTAGFYLSSEPASLKVMAPLKLAIIGGGPSSFYVASRLLSLFPQSDPLSSQLRIHVYDRLWAPHGLVRYGVAPDHPEVKVRIRASLRLASLSTCVRTAHTSSIRPPKTPAYVSSGTYRLDHKPRQRSHALPLLLSSLQPHYTHLLFSTGCAIPTLHPALPPQNASYPRSHSSTGYTHRPSRPAPPPLHETEHVSIIGQGNVALDVARMLLTPPAALEKYDIPEPVLDVLRRSAVRHVSIIGRRGPLQAAFTTKSCANSLSLDGTSMHPLAPELLGAPTPDAKLTRQQSRLMQLLQQQQQRGTSRPSHTKSWSLDFFRSPILPSPSPRPTGPGSH